MTRAFGAAGLALTVLTTAPLALRAQAGMPPDDPDSWKVAGTAKVLCSALFVSGRDSAEARAHVADYFLREKLDSISAFRIDRQRQLVRLTLAGRITREAKRYGDQGCVIHQPGRNTVFFRPVRVTSRLPDAAKTPWPMGDLLPDTPFPAGLDTAKLRQATDSAFANPAGLTAGFVVVHRGRIVAERYANGANPTMQLESWSMGKSITGTLVGMLIRQGAFRLEDSAPVPEWRKAPGDPRAKIRVIDLLRMSSGLRFSRGSPEDLPGYHDHDLIYTGAIDAFQFAVTREPQFPPNTFGRYRNVDVMTLGLLIRDAVHARGEEYLTWPQRALFDKIGIRRQVLETDPYGNFLLSGYDYGTPRNWARIGMLYLNDGVWNGERLLPEGWTRFVSTPAPAWADSSYGAMVWVNAKGVWPLPRDAFAFRGAGGQDTYVVPSLDLVVVRMGHFPGSRAGTQSLQRALPMIVQALPAGPKRVQAAESGVQQGTDSAAFVVRLGADTLSVERYVRRGSRIEAVSVVRSPRTVVGRLSLTLAPDGSVATFAAARGSQALEERAPAVAGTIPLVGGFWLPWELALQRARSAGRDSVVIDLLTGSNARPTSFRLTGANRFTFLSQFDQVMHGTLDSRRRMLALEIEGGGNTVERVAWLDVEAMARDFAARDSAGRGLGPLSPRDSTRAEVQGARIAVAYGRPSLRGRALDVLVPPRQVWRAGSNDATTITTDRPLAFEGYTLAPGTYSVFVQADAGRWTLILNRQTGMSGLDRNPAQDLARVPMQTRTNAPRTEQFTIEAAARGNAGILVFKWGSVEATAAFTVGPR